jgi:hypothetical protein
MPLSSLQTSIIALIGTVASLAVGFGVFSSTIEQLIVAGAGTLVSIVFQIVTELERKTTAVAGKRV